MNKIVLKRKLRESIFFINRKLPVAFFIIGVILLFLAVAGILIVCFCLDLVFAPNYVGLNNILKFFSTPIRFVAGAIAFFSLSAAFYQLKQNRTNIRWTRLNFSYNYYKQHKKEFYKYVKEFEIFQLLSKEDEHFSVEDRIQELHGIFYGRTIKTFRIGLNKFIAKQTQDYLNDLNSSEINDVGGVLAIVPIETLIHFSSENHSSLRRISGSVHRLLIAKEKDRLDLNPNVKQRLVYLIEIATSVSIIAIVMRFEGVECILPLDFLKSFHKILAEYGIEDVFIW